MTRLLSLPAFLMLILLIAGCAGNDSQPVSPVSTGPSLLRAPVSSFDHSLWGYWQCALDRESGEITAAPARTALMHINAVGPLNKSMGLSVSMDPTQSKPAEGYFVLTVSLTHPFPGNPKLTGFDVRGILITTAQYTAGSLPLPGEFDPKILNADGYTRWWNPTEFPVPGLLGYTPGIYGKDPPPSTPIASGINPYKQFADCLYYTLPLNFLTFVLPTSPNGRGVFRSGATNSRLYEIQFPAGSSGPTIYFNYAVDASWAMPSKENPIVPNDFPPAANSDEAFILNAQVTSNTLWAAGGPLGGGELQLTIELWDWQGWMVSYDGQIGVLKLVSPFCDFQDDVMPEVDTSGDGKAILTATISGVPSIYGKIPVWIGIIAPGSNYKQAWQPAPNEPVAAYTLVTVDVDQAECQLNDNKSCSTAAAIGANDSKQGILCLDVDETDWYSLTVLPGGSAQGTIHLNTYGVGDLDMFLYKGCPPSLVDYSSNTGTADEEITLNGLGEGDYFIQVLEADDGDGSPRPYTVITSLTGMGEDCTVDDDNDPDNANPIAIDGSQEATVCLIGDPTDWFTFDITAGTTGHGTIDLLNNNWGNNDIAVYDDTVSDPLYVGDLPGNLDENLDVVLGSGTYYVEIDAMGSSPQGDRPYTLSLDITEDVIVECDDQDGNNTPEEATVIGLAETKTGTVCFPSDPDWYTFDVAGDAVSGTVTLSSNDEFDNDLALYDDPAAPPLYESANVGTMDEVIEVADISEGTYYIRATASPDSAGANQDYSLTTDLGADTWGPVDFFVHCHIVTANDGTNPATTPEIVQTHVDWANQFWSKWIGGSVNMAELSYINRTSWLSLTTNESQQMFNQYGDGSGAVHVFYVNSFPDMPDAAAYTMMECEFENETNESTYIVMSDYADNATLAHELGHAIGLLEDMYLLDYYDCEDLDWCPTGPSDVYCDPDDAGWGNIMYWSVGEDVNDYWLSDDDMEMSTPPIESQGENVWYFQVNYPDAFYKP